MSSVKLTKPQERRLEALRRKTFYLRPNEKSAVLGDAMSKLRRLIDDLQETDGLVSRLNAAMSASPDDEILRINTESVQKRRDDLVRRLDQTLHNRLPKWAERLIAKGVARPVPGLIDDCPQAIEAV